MYQKNPKHVVKLEVFCVNLIDLKQQLWRQFGGFYFRKIWSGIKKLQEPDIDVHVVVQLYDSLISFLSRMRGEYHIYETNALQRATEQNYEVSKVRTKKRRLPNDETRDGEVEFSARDNFRINTFTIIIDRLLNELKNRNAAYVNFCEKFGFLNSLSSMKSEDILEAASRLQKHYTQDLDTEFPNEVFHIRSFLISLANPPIPFLKCTS